MYQSPRWTEVTITPEKEIIRASVKPVPLKDTESLPVECIIIAFINNLKNPAP